MRPKLEKAVKPRKRVFHREHVAKKFAGKTVTPSAIALWLGTDRSAACRILQRMVQVGAARPAGPRGHYKVGKV